MTIGSHAKKFPELLRPNRINYNGKLKVWFLKKITIGLNYTYNTPTASIAILLKVQVLTVPMISVEISASTIKSQNFPKNEDNTKI